MTLPHLSSDCLSTRRAGSRGHTAGVSRRLLLGAGPAAWVALSGLGLSGCQPQSAAAGKTRPGFRLGASVYVGWMPWMLAAQDGTLKAAADAKGIDISVVRADYAASIEQFVQGHTDAVVITNIDALSALASANVAADAILIGSYSNGNDAILVREHINRLSEGQEFALVENSVSHYLLARAAKAAQLPLSSIKLRNLPEAELAGALNSAGASLSGVVSWNPFLTDMQTRLNAKRLTDSAAFPKEIADMLIVRREVLSEHPEFAQALLQTWFQVTARLQSAQREATLAQLAQLSASSVDDYVAQLKTTLLIDKPVQAIAELLSERLPQTMALVEEFVRERKIVQSAPVGAWFSQAPGAPGLLHVNPVPLQQMGAAG